MKPLNLEETKLKEEMKDICLNKGQYIDKNAKAKYDMICHLEDFEVQYWELERENQELKSKFKATNKGLKKVVLKRKKWKHRYELTKHEIKEIKNQQKEFIDWLKEIIPYLKKHGIKNTPDKILEDVLSKYKEIIGGKDDNK